MCSADSLWALGSNWVSMPDSKHLYPMSILTGPELLILYFDDMLLVWFWSLVSCWRKKHGFAVPARLPGVPELALAVLCCLRCQVQLWAASSSLFLLFETGACWVARLVSPSFLCPAVRTSTCYHAWLRCLVQVFNSFTKIVTCHVYM